MGTRSAIGYRLGNGQVCAVYCHFDGYPSNQMPLLQEHFNHFLGALALVSGGFLRCLRKEPEYMDAPEHAETINRFSVEQHWRNMDCEHLYVYEGDDQGWVHTDLRED